MESHKRLSRKTIYENPWINLYADRVLCPGGRIVEEYHVLEFEKQAVGAVVENEHGEILLARVHRYSTHRLEWETPGGVIDEGEDILQAASREVREETGYDTVDLRHVYSFHPFNGMADKVFHVVRCRAAGRIAEPDPNEVGEIRWFTWDAIREMIRCNELYDGFTLVALLMTMTKVV